jgi:apolipoprotein N-acyltransferase
MRRYLLSILFAALLALSLYPFYLWPLALVALAPLFYFAALPHYSRKQIFWGAFFGGAVAVTPTLYFSLFQLTMQPGAPILTYAVRASSVFFFIFIGSLFGAVALSYRYLRTGQPLTDSLLAAALYTALECILFCAFNGYYYASLAHALTPFPPALIIASLGGTTLLVFVAAWISAVLAQHSWRLGLSVLIFLAVICSATYGYGRLQSKSGPTLAMAVIQRSPESLLYVTVPAPQPFGDYGLQTLITEAANGGKTNLVVYPFSPVEATYEGTQPLIFAEGLHNLEDAEGLHDTEPDAVVGSWLQTIVPASTTVMLWNTVSTGGNLYDSFEFWNNGTEQTYQKHILHPLSDYTPEWLRSLGLARVPYALTPGTADAVSLGGVQVGALACSELQQEAYTRSQASGRDLLLSVGYDGFFPGPMSSNWSLEAARLRAAENGLPLVRGHIIGPSALISATGAVVTSMPYGATGILSGSLLITKIPTLYSYTGSIPAYLLILASIGLAFYRRFGKKTISPDSADR